MKKSILCAALMTLCLAPGVAYAEARSAQPKPSIAAFDAPNLKPARKGAPAPLSTRAPNAIVIDVATGKILGEKASSRAIAPASMTKMMTALVAFEALEDGKVDLKSRLRVSARAARAIGSSMGLKKGDRPTVDDLLRGLIVASGNDAAAAIAEGISGSEQRFAKRMTLRARALGLKSARFRNASGLPAPGHRISVADLAKLSVHLIDEHPTRFSYFSEPHMRFRGVSRRNRNPALFIDLSDLDALADGLKTGHTREAGYCVAASAVIWRGGEPRRVVVVLAGLRSEAQRRRETARVLRWALKRVSETR